MITSYVLSHCTCFTLFRPDLNASSFSFQHNLYWFQEKVAQEHAKPTSLSNRIFVEKIRYVQTLNCGFDCAPLHKALSMFAKFVPQTQCSRMYNKITQGISCRPTIYSARTINLLLSLCKSQSYPLQMLHCVQKFHLTALTHCFDYQSLNHSKVGRSMSDSWRPVAPLFSLNYKSTSTFDAMSVTRAVKKPKFRYKKRQPCNESTVVH